MIRSVCALLIMAVPFLYATSCTKSSNGPVQAQSFEWSIDNGPTESAETITFIRQGYNYIYVTKGSTEIFLATSSTALGIYTLATTNANMGLKVSGKQYEILGCDVFINSNSNSRLKGTFNGTLGLVNVDTVNISGSFEDVAY